MASTARVLRGHVARERGDRPVGAGHDAVLGPAVERAQVLAVLDHAPLGDGAPGLGLECGAEQLGGRVPRGVAEHAVWVAAERAHPRDGGGVRVRPAPARIVRDDHVAQAVEDRRDARAGRLGVGARLLDLSERVVELLVRLLQLLGERLRLLHLVLELRRLLLELSVCLGQLLLALHAVRHVAHVAGEQAPAIDQRLAERDLHGRVAAVLRQDGQAHALPRHPARAAGHVARHARRVPRAEAVGHQHGEGLADQLRLCIARQPLGRSVHRHDRVRLVDDEDRVGRARGEHAVERGGERHCVAVNREVRA
jgi:hypothetical protein